MYHNMGNSLLLLLPLIRIELNSFECEDLNKKWRFFVDRNAKLKVLPLRRDIFKWRLNFEGILSSYSGHSVENSEFYLN